MLFRLINSIWIIQWNSFQQGQCQTIGCMTIINIWRLHSSEIQFSISLIRFSGDCLLTQWVKLMHLFLMVALNSLVLCGRISFLSVQRHQCFNRYSERRDTIFSLTEQSVQSSQVPGSFPLHLPVLPVYAYCDFRGWDGINPPHFYLNNWRQDS